MQIIFEGKHATGVVVQVGDKQTVIKATKELILAAGTVGTTKLLLQSGIGPRNHLQSVKVRQTRLPSDQHILLQISMLSLSQSFLAKSSDVNIRGSAPPHVTIITCHNICLFSDRILNNCCAFEVYTRTWEYRWAYYVACSRLFVYFTYSWRTWMLCLQYVFTFCILKICPYSEDSSCCWSAGWRKSPRPGLRWRNRILYSLPRSYDFNGQGW